MSRQIMLHKQMKVRRIIYLMKNKTSINEFVTKFKEEYPDDYKAIVNRYESHSEKSDKHPMSEPDVYLKNMYRNEFWSYMDILSKSEKLKDHVFKPNTHDSISELFKLDKTFPFNIIESLEDDHWQVDVDIYNINLNDFYKVLISLPEREMTILKLRFREKLTLKEVGNVIGVGDERVRQLQNIALNKLRKRISIFKSIE